jgi:hypothetical protein
MIALLLAMAAAAQAPAMPAFITGCWNLVEGQRWTQECWMEPRAGLMLGASREGTGNKLQSWEQMRIELSADGKITFIPAPGGRVAPPFEGRVVSANVIEFTNAAHGYPQRIRYELKDGTLHVEISLIDGSKPTLWVYGRENR